jgi:hypothetical protein
VFKDMTRKYGNSSHINKLRAHTLLSAVLNLVWCPGSGSVVLNAASPNAWRADTEKLNSHIVKCVTVSCSSRIAGVLEFLCRPEF